MIFEGMWKGVLLGFTALSFVIVMFFTVFSKIMPGVNDEGEELSPEEM
jgi:xanthine/uracil/vitamin C permease (AzgA family)